MQKRDYVVAEDWNHLLDEKDTFYNTLIENVRMNIRIDINKFKIIYIFKCKYILGVKKY